MAYIGIDIGTSGCKASVIDVDGNILAYSYKEYCLKFPKPGWVEIDPEEVWQAVKYVIYHAIRAHGDVRALAISSFGEAVVLLDENDAVLGNSIFYSDIRGSEEIRDIITAIDREKLQKITGMPVNPMYSANKLIWLKKHEPEQYFRARKMMLMGDYITYKLTGERVIDLSLASRTMLLDIHEGKWSEEVAGAFGIDVSLFSKPVRSGTVIGKVSRSVAEELCIPSDLVVIAGGHDQACAALGAGAVFPGDSVDGMGSSECITIVMNKESITSDMFEHNYCCEPFVINARYITLAFNTTSGAAIKWYRDTIEDERFNNFKGKKHEFYSLLDSECTPGPSPLLFLPYLAGSGTPFMDAEASGALLGIKLSTKKADIYKTILESICFEIMHNIDTLGTCGILIDKIVAVGGASKSDVLMQMKANIMNMPIQTLKSAEAGTIGLGILCGYALGDYDSIENASKHMVVLGKTYYPEEKYTAAYSDKLKAYKRIYPAVKQVFGQKEKYLNWQ